MLEATIAHEFFYFRRQEAAEELGTLAEQAVVADHAHRDDEKPQHYAEGVVTHRQIEYAREEGHGNRNSNGPRAFDGINALVG